MDSPPLDPNNDRQRDFFQQLPDEMLTHIFRFLDATDLMSLDVVCHRFRAISSHCYRWITHYTLHLHAGQNLASKMLYTQKRVFELIGTNLRSLHVMNVPTQNDSSQIQTNQDQMDILIWRYCTQLSHLRYTNRVNSNHLHGTIPDMQQLKSLIFVQPSLSTRQLNLFLESAPKLTTFKVYSTDQYNNCIGQPVPIYWRNTTDLNVVKIRSDLSAIARVPSLTNVTLSLPIRTHDLWHLMACVPSGCKWETLNLHVMVQVFESITQFFDVMSRLRELRVTIIDGPARNETLADLHLLPRLEHFELITRNEIHIDMTKRLWQNTKDIVQEAVEVEGVACWKMIVRWTVKQH